MATRAKSKRKTAGKSKGRGRASSAATKRSAKRATSRTRSGAVKRAGSKRATTKRATTKRATTKGRAAPKRGATTKRRSAARGRTGMRRGMSQRGRSALAKAARMMQQEAEQETPGDAIALLEHDHREVESLYQQFEEAESSSEKSELAWKICLALTVHAQIEEEIFYPRARRNIDETDLLDEAQVEHASVKQLIAEIEEMTPRDKLFDATVKVLVEYVKHHVKEEEEELFPKVRESGMDLDAMGHMLSERKLEILSAFSGKA